MAKMLPRRRGPHTLILTIVTLLVVRLSPYGRCSFFHGVAAEEQVTWTPNESDADGSNPAIPLSMKQRQQLLQLQQTIMSSEDPDGTLQQAAQANGMSPSDLVEILQKNARDLQERPSLLEPRTLPKMIWNMMMSLLALIGQVAKKHPRNFGLSVTSLFLFLYLSTMVVPRTGLHLSTSRGGPPFFFLSNGPTTVWAPPDRYLQKLLTKQVESSSPSALGIKNIKTRWDDLTATGEDDGDENDVGIRVHSMPRSHKELSQAVTAQFTISADDLLQEILDPDAYKDMLEEELAEERDDIAHMLYVNARKALMERQLTEFAAITWNDGDEEEEKSGAAVRCVVSDDDVDMGLLVVPGLGDLRRYGLVFWQATDERETRKGATASTSLTLTTLKRLSSFDGQIHWFVQQVDGSDEDTTDETKAGVQIQVHLVVPKGHKKVSAQLGRKIVGQLASSLKQSSVRRTQQTLARRKQGRRFQQSGSRRASERRHSRFQREKQLEEMAEDRRRKWQRQNQDAGRYRPSGRRQRSPNNC